MYSIYRDAIRILYILSAGSVPVVEPLPSGAVAVFQGEKRLHAFDFWMRSPDYLADELLDQFDQTQEPHYLAAAQNILATDEPDIRRFPMIRFRFGAYDPLDNTLSVLVCRRLIRIAIHTVDARVSRKDFEIMPAAFSLTRTIVSQFPPLAWYRDRAALVAEIAGQDGGNALKNRQYAKTEYAETELGGTIPAITDKVRARLDALMTPILA